MVIISLPHRIHRGPRCSLLSIDIQHRAPAEIVFSIPGRQTMLHNATAYLLSLHRTRLREQLRAEFANGCHPLNSIALLTLFHTLERVRSFRD